MKEQIWSLGGSGFPMTFVDLCYQPLTWTNVVSMETGLRIGLQRGWVVDGVADTSWITALDQSMEFRHLGPWIRTQRQGGEMIWNSIGLYFLGGLVQGEDNYSTCGNGLEAYWIMTNQLVNIRWFSSLVWIFGQCSFGIYTNAVDSIKLGGDVVFYLRCNAKSTFHRCCDSIGVGTRHSLQEEEGILQQYIQWTGYILHGMESSMVEQPHQQ